MALDLTKIVQENFPEDQFVKEETVKKQITLHHTVSGIGVKGDIRHWLTDPKRIATQMIIAHDGTIHQCFSSKYWGYHLGIEESVFKKRGIKYQRLDKIAIAIEIDGYGGLKKKNGKWYNSYDIEVDSKTVYEYAEPYRGYYGYERYTDAQIKAVEDLLLYWGERYGIPLDYNEDMWDVSDRALKGEAGIWSHTSYRSDKSDIHPQPEMIAMLKGLKSKQKK